MFASNTTISSDGNSSSAPSQQQKLFNVLINYPENYEGAKFFKDGDIKREVSEETANAFVKQGFGKIISDEELAALTQKPAEEKQGTGDTGKKEYAKMNKQELQAELTKRELPFNAADTKAILIGLLEEADKAAEQTE